MTTPTTTTAKPQITYEDFSKLDLRVATVMAAEAHPNADRLLKVQLDDGSGTPRQVCAGIRQWYDPATLVGRQVVIVANLAPKTIRGEVSQGMILAASDVKEPAVPGAPGGAPGGAVEERDVIVLSVDRPAKPGSTVS